MILNQTNLIPQAVITNGLITGNLVQNPDNLLNTTDSVALFGATTDVLLGNFPFSIPLGAVIVGISGKMKARILNSSIPNGSVTPSLIDPTTGLQFPGTPVTGMSSVLQEYDFGGDYDIWGNVSWTPTKINNLQLDLLANQGIEVAWATLTVFYYIPATTPVPPPFTLPGCEDCDSEIQALPFKLKRVWRTGETTLLLETFNAADGTPIDLAMLGECGGTINITIDPDKSREAGGNFIENFNLNDALATITITAQGVELDIGNINQRGLGFFTPYGHDVTNISEHGVGAILIITNNGPWNSKLLKRCHVGTVVSAPITIQDEGNTVVVAMETTNYRGPNVQASQDPSDQRKANVDIVATPTNVQPTTEATATGTNNTTPSLTLTVPLTIVSANYLRVAVITEDETITSVEYDGVAMTLIGEQVNPGVNLKVALFGLINPTVGLHNVVVTMPTPRIITAIATSWLDVDTTNPTDGVSAGAIGSDDQPTDSVTTTTDNTVMQDVVGTTNNPTTFTQFGLWAIQGAVTTGIRPGSSASRRVLLPQSVTDIYQISLSTGWAILLAGIRGISSPSASGITSINGDTTAAQLLTNTDTLISITQPVAGTNRFGIVLANLVTALLGSASFISGLVSNLINNVSFINGLTSNALFQTLVNAFTGGGGGGVAYQIDQTPDNGTYGLLAGAVDGVNKIFTVSAGEYVSGKLLVFLNGVAQLQGAGDDFVELSPASGTFEFDVAPDGDVVTAMYIPTVAPASNLEVLIDNVSLETAVVKINFKNGPTGTNPATGEVDIDFAALLGGGSGGTKLAIDTTAITVDNTTTETDLYSIPIPGGILGTNDAIKYRIAVSDLGMLGNNITGLILRVTYGGVAFGVINLNESADVLSGLKGYIEGYIIANGATNAQKSQVSLWATENSSESHPDANVRINKSQASDVTTGVVDSTITQNLVISADWGNASPSNTITADSIIVEKITSGSGSSEKFVGVGGTANKLYHNFQIPFVAGQNSDDLWAFSNPQLVSYSALQMSNTNQKAFLQNNGIGDMFGAFADWDAVDGARTFDTQKETILEFPAKIGADVALAGDDIFMGFTEYNDGVVPSYGTNTLSIGFSKKGDTGAWYIRSATGAARTETAISTPTDGVHNWRVEYDPATTEARFYIDGVSVGTITTNLPTAINTPIGLMYSNEGTTQEGIKTIGCPSIAVEL